MHFTVVSSLDSQCRESATERLGRTHGNSVVVLHDLLDGSLVLRRVYREGRLIERETTVLEHGCLSCTVRLDVVPTAERLAASGFGHVVLGLPPGVATGMALAELRRSLEGPVVIDNAVLAVDPADVDNHIWDRHTLFESGFTSMPTDERTSGEFLVGEFGQVDTVLMAPGLGAVLSGEAGEGTEPWLTGEELLGELAPHANLVGPADVFRPGCFDPAEAAARNRPGVVRLPASDSRGSFTTVLHKAGRPLHPGRFRDALPHLASGTHWLRGRLWIASAPEIRIAVQGIGPRVWLESTGKWLADSNDRAPGATGQRHHQGVDVDAALDWQPSYGDRGTVLAITGYSQDVDPQEVRELLDRCQLTEAEMHADSGVWEDPLDLSNAL
ncbi:GTP-binding protein [Paenarthrobacter nitroguajacolicus]|uniref:GTP-binding protein n=1 Tax=Paenarthrobacter nitroguajacolicus TaxID=211146 RepID=UPI00248CF64D|nr:GTP-binding protein [Paenarthrobacter nitroguajacolicus]MDI2034491.1 putative metal chaperone YciC [Paenarthrobacter nitroguajacolicus]